MRRYTPPPNQLGSGALSPAAEAWLSAHGAVFARVDADGVIEFSARPIRAALTDAAVDLLAHRQASDRAELVPV